jgi:hypothetical protein
VLPRSVDVSASADLGRGIERTRRQPPGKSHEQFSGPVQAAISVTQRTFSLVSGQVFAGTGRKAVGISIRRLAVRRTDCEPGFAFRESSDGHRLRALRPLEERTEQDAFAVD